MKKHLPTIIVVIIFLCGFSLFLYPTVSNLYNEHLNKQYIYKTEEVTKNYTNEELEQMRADAEKYNESMNNPDKLKELGLTYDKVLNLYGNGAMGYIEIPKISVSLMIYHTVEEDKLQDGLGHVEGTALPIGGESRHSVLAGHTGLPSAKLLTNLDRMEIGDKFYIHVLDEVLEYVVDDVRIVEPEEVNAINIVKGKDLVTLVTCTPYGINSHRLLVRGVRIDNHDTSSGSEMNVGNDVERVEMRYMVTFSLIGLLLVIFAVYKFIKTIRRNKKGGEASGDKK